MKLTFGILGPRQCSAGLLVTAGLMLATFDASAQPVADGSEFHVNVQTEHAQSNPRIAVSESGQSVAVWLDNLHTVSRIHSSGGTPLSSEIVVDTSSSFGYYPDVAMWPDGSFIVVWISGGNVLGQRFSADGARNGPTFQVNIPNSGTPYLPDVAVHAGDYFVIVWSAPKPAGTGNVLYARIYDAHGSSSGGPILLNNQFRTQENPSVAIDAQGRLLVAWYGTGYVPTSQSGIFAQWYDGSGIPTGEEFRVNTTNYQVSDPAAAVSPGGRFAVVWTSQYQDGDSDGVYGRVFGANGEASNTEFQINSTIEGRQANPDVGMDSTGRFVVIWQGPDPERTDVRDIYAQSYSPDGAPVGAEFRVSEEGGIDNDTPSLALRADGRFLVAWRSYREVVQHEIYARGFSWPLAVNMDEPSSPAAADFVLHSPHPNPFSNRIHISLDVRSTAIFQIELVDLLGRSVAIIADGPLATGSHSFAWEPDGLPAGIYICRVQSPAGTAARTLVLVR